MLPVAGCEAFPWNSFARFNELSTSCHLLSCCAVLCCAGHLSGAFCSGVTIDWAKVQVPRGCYKLGWILAGGLTPANVAQAISALSPDVVDVSSGVCGPDKLAKDHVLIREFTVSALEPRTLGS